MAQNPQRSNKKTTVKHLNNDIYKLTNKNLVEKHYLHEKMQINLV